MPEPTPDRHVRRMMSKPTPEQVEEARYLLRDRDPEFTLRAVASALAARDARIAELEAVCLLYELGDPDVASALAARDARIAELEAARALAAAQAEDEGLWFEAETAPEAYLQAALRRMHAVVEGSPDEDA